MAAGCRATVFVVELDLEVSVARAQLLHTSELSQCCSLLAEQRCIERLHGSLALPSTPVSHRVAAGDAVARRSRKPTWESVRPLLADEVPGCEEAGPGSVFVDRNPEIPGGGPVFGVIEISRTRNSEMELGDGSRARG